jgi:hypothetical protein
MSEKCEHGSNDCAVCHDASGNLKENERMEITSTVLLGRDAMERDIKNKGGNDALMEMVATMDYETLRVLHSNICRPNAPHQARRGSGVALNAVVGHSESGAE